MNKLKSLFLSLWLVNLFLPKTTAKTTVESIRVDNIDYAVIHVRTRKEPDFVTLNQYNIPVKTVDSIDSIRYPTNPADGIKAYSSASFSGIFIVAMAGYAMSDYCKTIILFSD